MALLPFSRQASEETNVVELLRKDHEKVKHLFRAFESAERDEEKMEIVRQAMTELERHAAAEEKVFYPAVREDWPDTDRHLNESFEEHHVMRLLIGELKDMSASDERFDAKFTVLAENVKHHIQEEEAEVFAKARTGRLDLVELGRQLTKAKAADPLRSRRDAKKPASKRKSTERRAGTKR